MASATAAPSQSPVSTFGNIEHPTSERVQRLVTDVYERFKGLREGKVADYIPALAKE